MAEGTPRTIETRIELHAPVEAVWAALTEADELTNWFPLHAKVKPGVGGSVWTAWDDPGLEWETPVGAWKENEHLQLIYADPTPPDVQKPDFFVPFRVAVDYHLEARSGGTTVLRLVHSGFSSDPSWDNQYDGTVRGWAFELRGLKHYLEHHRGTKRVVVHARADLGDSPLDEAWARLVSDRGLIADGALPAEAGDEYAFTTATGDRFEGVTHIVRPPGDLCATVENLNNGLLRLRLDEACMTAPKREAHVWISTYGMTVPETDALQGRLQSLVDTLFPVLSAP